jgi:hypothetical protein
MPARNNPFYRYRNPAVGYGMNGLAAAMFPDAAGMTPLQQSQIAENQAQTSAATALAGYRGEQTRGERDVNNAMVSAPTAIAELLLSGGVLQSDPMRANPDYKAPTPIDFASILTNPAQINQPISSPILPGATAQDKLAAAIQEATIRKIRLDDMLKAAGINGFTQRAAGQNPDSALAFAPFVGVSPNQNTALTTGRQDAISARDAGEARAQADSVATINANSAAVVERIRQGGANDRNRYNQDNKPVSAGNNVDVIVSPAQGKALGIVPNAEGQYIVRGRATVGAGQDQYPGSLGGTNAAGRQSSSIEVARINQEGSTLRQNTRPVAVGNNVDVIVSPEQGKALGLTPDEQGRYVIRGRATVGTGQDQAAGSLGGPNTAGRQSSAPEVARINQAGATERQNGRPVAAGNNVDVIVSEAQGKALGITPNAQGQYVIQGRATVGAGQDQRPGTAGGSVISGRDRPGRVPADRGPTAVPTAATKRMESKIREALKADGVVADESVVLGLVSAAGAAWQTSKNPDSAADGVIQRLRAGETVNGVSMSKGNRRVLGVPVPGTERSNASRAKPLTQAEIQDARQRAVDAIASGAPREAVLQRLRENGIDPKGL